MGLISYFKPDHKHNERDEEISNQDTFNLESFLPPYFQAVETPSIAIGNNKCCWCCQKLYHYTNPISTPASHGIIYPWCPPRVGISLHVLEWMETQLWDKLHLTLREENQYPSSRRSLKSSGSSSTIFSDSEIESNRFLLPVREEILYRVEISKSDPTSFTVIDLKTGESRVDNINDGC